MAQIRWKTFVIIILPSVVLSIAAWHNFSVSQDDVMYLANDDEQRHIADIRSNDEHQSLDDVRRKQSGRGIIVIIIIATPINNLYGAFISVI